jgi:hypothetical protein
MKAMARLEGVPGSLDIVAFVHKHGRLPRVDDEPPPWHYRGWLLAYVILLHEVCPAVADRWDYHLRTLEARKLLQQPIPQVSFGAPDSRVFSMLQEWSRLIGRDFGGWSDFRMLLDWLCWGLALGKEEPKLAEDAHEKLYRQVDVGPLLVAPYDYLGEYVAQGKAKGWNPTGFYPTPHSVVELMVRMTMQDEPSEGRDPRTRRVCDPAVGSGRMLLHSSNCSMSLWGQDIDPLAVAMCKINGALYAPWLSFPLPESILESRVPPPPAPLPVRQPRTARARVYRVDDRKQGLLFDV